MFLGPSWVLVPLLTTYAHSVIVVGRNKQAQYSEDRVTHLVWGVE